MNTTLPDRKPHSAEYFGAERDYWWNSDFLELTARRLRLREVRTVLDVGCGIGHWGQVLAPVLASDAQLTGIDRETVWVDQASERATQRGLSGRYRYRTGDLTALAFPDDQFDLVTCQTVLIHVADPKAALSEMLRVLKPGGLLLAAEPNNFANRALFCSQSERLSVDDIIARLKFGLHVERGKQALGLGFNSIGDLIPGLLAELGAGEIQVYLSDKTTPLLPPYDGPDQKAAIALMRDWAKRRFAGWDKDELQAYFLAGGGLPDTFEAGFRQILADQEDAIEAIESGRYHCAGGSVFYLIAARKDQAPTSAPPAAMP